MAMNIKYVRVLLLLTAIGLIAPLTSGIAYAKKPDCNADPSHPSCGGDDGGGSETTCATSDTFPTFVYATASGSEGTLFNLSDADGSCVQTLTTYEGGTYIQGQFKLDYQPPVTSGDFGTGRFVWQDKSGARAIFLTEFTVIPGNIITVTMVASGHRRSEPWPWQSHEPLGRGRPVPCPSTSRVRLGPGPCPHPWPSPCRRSVAVI